MRDKTVSYESQIDALVDELTLEEKVQMIHGSGFFRTGSVDRLGIPFVRSSDGPMGVRQEFPDDSWFPFRYSDDFVNYSPSNSALAATWNPDCAYAGGKTLGEEARGRGKDVILAPGINIKRDPLCGRNFEYMSEDPYLVSSLVVPFIQGVQENDVAACVKHFAVNNQETDRLAVDTIVDERALREIYLPGFKAACQDADSYSIMNAYNKFRGAFCSENKELLDTILREEWGYDGTVISDWGSVHSTKGAAETSMDMEMSVTTNFDEYYLANPLIEAVKKGEIAEEEVDKKVRNILRMMFRLKMIGEDAKFRKTGAYDTDEHQEGTLKIAREGIVLLKNESKLLPITKERLAMVPVKTPVKGVTSIKKKRIAVIGVNASYQHSNGGGSAEIKALYEVSPLLGIKKLLGGNVDVSYAPGYYVPGAKDVNEVNWQEASLERRIMGVNAEETEEQIALKKEIEEKRAALKAAALAIAKDADEVIFVGGLNHDYDVEGRDRDDMKLPYAQDDLVEALLDINPNTIVVMVAGSPVEMPWANRAKAIVWCYYSGMETGTALAEILTGKTNPSGKLPETMPVVYTDTVTYKNGEFGKMNSVEYKEGIFVGYRYYEKENVKPAFAFGHGLSYSTFSIKDLQVEKEADDKVLVSVTVTNSGKTAGAEVVQCYVSDVECSVERPAKELKGYKKVFLQSGESKNVTITLAKDAFSFYDVDKKDFVVENGKFVISVGNASDHCTLTGEVEI